MKYLPILSVLDKITGKTAAEAAPIVAEHFLEITPYQTTEEATNNLMKAYVGEA